ncbi:MAG: hypothetical protein AAFP92_32245, partial [Bacteroidota bacterium]
DSFTDYQNQIQEKLQALRKEIKNGKDALEISERYSNKADGLVSLFLGLFGLILTLASVFLGFFLKSLFDRKTERMERDLQNQLQESIETFRRITSTEKESIFIKKNARILAVSGEDASPDLLAIQLALSNFNTEKLSISSLPDLLNSRIFREFMESDAPLRVMLVGDELFSETYNGQAGSDNLAELDMAAKRVFSLIETQEIGLVNFGRMKMPKSIHYQAFSNSPYSAYTNLNSLLKYMLATKEIEI